MIGTTDTERTSRLKQNLEMAIAATDFFPPSSPSASNSQTNEMKNEEFQNLHVIYLCNRAACLFRMELWDEAKRDALQALEVSNGKSAKASFRLAKSHLELGEYTQAVQVTEEALKQLQLGMEDTNTNTNTVTNTNTNTKKEGGGVVQTELKKVLEQARMLHLKQHKVPNAQTLAMVHSIKEEPRKPSIREFEVLRGLGEGNFSKVVAVRHSSK